MKALRIVAVSAAAAALLVVPNASSMPTASADGCPDVEVVFARGTSEPPGLGRVGDGLVGALRGRRPGRSAPMR